MTEPRDAMGKKLRLTEQVRDRAQQLMHDFGGPEHLGDRRSNREPARKGGVKLNELDRTARDVRLCMECI